MNIAFTIVLTFLAAAGTDTRAIGCPDWDCVDRVMLLSLDSPRLARLRVFEGHPTQMQSGLFIFPPMIDEQRQ